MRIIHRNLKRESDLLDSDEEQKREMNSYD